MIHWPIHPLSIRHFTDDPQIISNPPTIDEAIEGLRLLRAQGKIREFGMSNFSRHRMDDLPVDEIAVNELPYNLLCRAIEYDTLPFCHDRGVGIIGYMSLLQGILAGKFRKLDEVPGWRKRTRHFDCRKVKECRHGEEGAEVETNMALDGIRNLSRETGLTMAELALKWILQNPAITCTLVGSRNIKQLEANVKAIQGPLHSDIKTRLDRITFPVMEKLGNHIDYYEGAENDRTS